MITFTLTRHPPLHSRPAFFQNRTFPRAVGYRLPSPPPDPGQRSCFWQVQAFTQIVLGSWSFVSIFFMTTKKTGNFIKSSKSLSWFGRGPLFTCMLLLKCFQARKILLFLWAYPKKWLPNLVDGADDDRWKVDLGERPSGRRYRCHLKRWVFVGLHIRHSWPDERLCKRTKGKRTKRHVTKLTFRIGKP